MRNPGDVMILQVGADAAQIVHHRHADRLQMFGRSRHRKLAADCGELTEPPHRMTSLCARRLDRLARVGGRRRQCTCVPSNSSFVASASVSTRRLGRRLASLRKVCAVDPRQRPLRVICEYPTPSCCRPFRSLLNWKPACCAASMKRVGQRQYRAVVFDFQRAALAAVFRVGALLVILRLAEIWQHVIEAPAAAAHLRPAVEVRWIAAHVQHAVDRARTAQRLAARPVDAPPPLPSVPSEL